MFVYNLIEELCIKKGISITVLCRDCGIPRSVLTDYKMGRTKNLSLGVITKIADYFDVNVGYLCGSPIPAANEEALRTALFGEGVVVTDQMWNEVKEYAQFVKNKYAR